MEVEKVSTQFVKPFTSTPIHLKTYQICLLDQYAPHGFGPIVLVFPAMTRNTSGADRSSILKNSLSHALTRFYPFAGNISHDNLSIDCNDVGVPFIESRVNCSLVDYLQNPNLSLLHKFLPDGYVNLESHVIRVQQNVFTCGGIALGLRFWHVIIDAAVVATLLKTWSAFARKANHQVAFPDFAASSIFPQNKSFPHQLNSMVLAFPAFKVGDASSRRFVFDGSVIAKLKNEFTVRSVIQNPRRAEVVIATLVKLVTAAMKKSSKLRIKKQTCVNFPVNMRPRATPVLSETTVGNLLMIGTLLTTDEDDVDGIALKMREARSMINGDLVKSLAGEGGLVKLVAMAEELGRALSNTECEHIGFNSWCNFGLYDLDFGWGKPLWIPFEYQTVKNYIFVIDTRHGNGIEAWVTLDPDVMALVEQDEELLSLCSVDLSPLQLCNPTSSSFSSKL